MSGKRGARDMLGPANDAKPAGMSCDPRDLNTSPRAAIMMRRRMADSAGRRMSMMALKR